MLRRSKNRRSAADDRDGDDTYDAPLLPDGQWWTVPQLQREAESAATMDDRSGMRNLLGLLDENTTGPVLGMRVKSDGVIMPLLGLIFWLGRKKIATEILEFFELSDAAPAVVRECLRDADDGRSVMQLAARWFSDGSQKEGDDHVGIRDTAVDMLHAAYFRLAENGTLDREKVDEPYAKYYYDIVHPGPPEDASSQTDGFPPRLSIVVSAHGADMVDKVFDTPRRSPRRVDNSMGEMKVDNIAVMHYGPGVCDLPAMGSAQSSHDFERVVWAATRSHESNTFATMQQLQPRLRDMYAKQHKKGHLADDMATAIIDANEHCIIANPYLDRFYSFMKAGSALRMVQCFNSPYNDLVGKNLFGPEMRQRIREHHPKAAQRLDEWFEYGEETFTYRGTIIQSSLSDIAEILSLMGFAALNVYDYACRNLVAVSDAARGTIHGTPERRKSAARRVSEWEKEKLVERAYGGGSKRRRRKRRGGARRATTTTTTQRRPSGRRRQPTRRRHHIRD